LIFNILHIGFKSDLFIEPVTIMTTSIFYSDTECFRCVETLTQKIPAYVVDAVSKLAGRPPFLVEVYKRTVKSMEVLT
jgi:hypothetical protein